MFDIRVDDAPYKTVKSKTQLFIEIGRFIMEKNPFFTIQVINEEGHEVVSIDGDIMKKLKK